LFSESVPDTPATSFPAALLASSAECRFSVGRSGSSAGTDPVEPLDDAVLFVELSVLSEDRRFIVGRSGSSAGAFDVSVVDAGDVVDAVVEAAPSADEPDELSDRRFIVGRSGSSAGVLPLPCVDAVSVLALPDDAVVPLLALSSEVPEDRRFIVGLSGSSVEALVDPLPDPALAVVPLWPLPAAVLSLGDLFVICGRLASVVVDVVEPVEPVELINTGSVFEGFSFAAFFTAASGFTLPYPNHPSS
jgi:hypothetical protein